MGTPIKILRNALFELVEGIDISAIAYIGWEFRNGYPPNDRVCQGFWMEPISSHPDYFCPSHTHRLNC